MADVLRVIVDWLRQPSSPEHDVCREKDHCVTDAMCGRATNVALILGKRMLSLLEVLPSSRCHDVHILGMFPRKETVSAAEIFSEIITQGQTVSL